LNAPRSIFYLASIYLDQDVSVLLARLLRARHFEVLTTQETDCLGDSDTQQLDFAIQNEMAILTHNRVHFENLFHEYLERGKSHYGIIIAKQRLPNENLKRLLKILNSVTAEELENQIRYM